MKPELERVDFGGHPKYNGGSTFGNVLFPGRSEKFNITKKAQASSLFDLNPHRFGLGLKLEDYTASKLCPRPSLAELHSDAAAEAATAALPAAAASTGAVLERSVSPDAAAHQLSKQQQQQEEQGGSAAGPAPEPEAHGRRKRQRLSQTPQAAATAAAAAAGEDTRQVGQPPSLDTPASLSANEEGSGSPSGDSGFVFIDSSSSSEDEDEGGGGDHDGSQGSGSGSDSDSDAAEDAGDASLNAGRAAVQQGAGEGEGVEKQTSSRRKKQRQKQQQGRKDRHERGDTAAAAAAAGDGEEDELMLSLSEESEGSDGGDDGDGHTVTLSGDEDEDSEEFVPLLDLPPGPGTDDPQDPHSTLQQQQQQRAVSGYQPPWLPRLAYFSSPLMRLHNEIVAFCQMLAPTAEEIASRAASLDSLRDVVRSIWPAAGVKVFGSYETGLYTPASDTDVVVVDSGMHNAQTGLKALAQALEARHLVRNMQLVLSARVPIIKFEMIDSGLAFDVSWEVPSGPQGAQVVKQLLEEWPALKPLALVLKVFLTQRELNEVYTGGVGSYTLIIMIVSFLQLHQSRRPDSTQQRSGSSSHKRRRSGGSNGSSQAQELDSNLGLLLVDFMRLYGRVLNLNQVGISCTQGAFFQRSLRGFSHINRKRGAFVPPGQMSLSVQDPIDPTNDTARGSFNMKLVRQVFDHAYQLLNAPCASNVSLLGRIIHLAPVVSGRPVPPWCVEAPSRGQQQQNDRRSSRHDRDERHHHRSSRDSRSRSPSRHKHGHSSRGREKKGSRDHSRDREREKGHRQNGSRSRSRSKSRSGKHSSGKQHEHHHHHKQHKSSSSKEHHRRHSSDSGSKQRKKDKGRSSSEHKDSGRQQKIDKWVQPSPDSSRGGQGSRGLGSRQSFGSDSGREYGHRDKRRRF